MYNSSFRLFPVCALILLFSLSFSCKQKGASEKVYDEWADSLQCVYQYGICTDSLDVTEYLIKSGDSQSTIFASLGFSPFMSDSISRSVSHILEPTRLRAGMRYYTFTTQDSAATIQHIAFARTLTDYAVIDLTQDTVAVTTYSKPITLKRKYLEGTLNSSLWNVIKAEGGDPLLALKLSDVYAWQIDFFDVKDGDSFKVLYDVAYIDDTTSLGVSKIHSSIFTHRNKPFIAIPFEQDSISEYFDEEGNSLRKAFLKAPLDFFRITSRFSNSRMHPVLRIRRAHHGVDYAAPTGTPVRSIGAGSVIERGYQANGAGNFIKIKHNAVYTTTYMHLSRFAANLAVGKTVQQGEVIGYVGSTGLSTGPHLDFRVHKNGQPIDPLQMDAPPSLPVKPELMDSFMIIKNTVLAELDSLSINYKPL